ncbi:cysteine-rich motor neuron 1 protein-like isoform X1 [Oncorhynchus keta]|uniref:cysteine-rich motor neuron 1 protein-like isoform X1 n=1 Tax=Oncorhynchus keta TaxID=8018 RepID=UPI0015F7DE12|nr:cysteine-rich motor neuron 1 protein-like isoform X1 [Oncorhynchus keta]
MMFRSLSEELKLSSSLCFGTVSWVIDNRAMVWVYLGLWVFLLGCSTSQLHGQVILGKGEVCGGAVEGQCDTNLTCVSVKPADKELTPSAGLCSPPLAPGCVPCSGVLCPHARRVCPGGHVTEPCGCCPQCARQMGQVCGGPHWEKGYCDRDLTCTLFTGRSPARPPHTGVCKVLLGHQADPLADPLCPWMWGCNVRAGACDCYSLQTCHAAFSYHSLDQCLKTMRGDELWSEMEEQGEHTCVEWGCELQGSQCVCMERSCYSPTPLFSEDTCENMLQRARCSNVKCPEVQDPSCPADSFLTEPYIPHGQCCPLVPAICTCNFDKCPLAPPTCPPGQQVHGVESRDGLPGACCHQYQCV